MRKAIFVFLLVCLVSLPLTAFARNVPPYYWLSSLDDEVFWSGPQFVQHTQEEPAIITVARTLPDRLEGLDIYGDVPGQFTSSFGYGLAYSYINERVDDVIDLLISDARRVRARSITFSYQEYRAYGVVSILIEANVSSVISRNLVRSVNFDPVTGELVTIRDVMEFDVVPLAERLLADRMRRYPENYYAAQSVSLDTQAFFVNSRGITILFDEFQLSAMVRDIRMLEISHDNIRHVTIDMSRVLSTTGASYGLLMIPLRDVVEGLGFYAAWCTDEGLAVIYDIAPVAGGQRLAWMKPGHNDYFTPTMQRSLEAAPQIRNGGHTYVPITFFEQILTLTTYTIDNRNITFLAYLN